MTSIISAVSGRLTTSFVLSTFFPVVLFVVFFIMFVVPRFPSGMSAPWPLGELGLTSLWLTIIVFLFLVTVLSGFVYSLNAPIVRFYEGYPWKDSWIGKQRVRRYATKYKNLDARWRGMRTLLYAMDKRLAELKDEPRPLERAVHGEMQRIEARRPKVSFEWSRIGREFDGNLPRLRFSDASPSMVLPTRLGNVIRSFETYANRQYRIATITLWPRLTAKIGKEYGAAIKNEKASFDFMVNGSMLSALLAISVLLVGLVYREPLRAFQVWPPNSFHAWLVEVLAFATLAYLFYLWSIGQAAAWGVMVRGAFDLYRRDLLTQLGYTHEPVNLAEERVVWGRITSQMIFGDSPRVRLPEYAPTPTLAHGEPEYVALEVARGAKLPTKIGGEPITGGPIQITLSARNVDKHERAAEKVIVTDTLPDGLEYEWGSAELKMEPANLVDSSVVPVTGTNPYHFEVGVLPPNGEAKIVYRAVPRPIES